MCCSCHDKGGAGSHPEHLHDFSDDATAMASLGGPQKSRSSRSGGSSNDHKVRICIFVLCRLEVILADQPQAVVVAPYTGSGR
jgi:hypothetical protein